jgi:hypothetical protein
MDSFKFWIRSNLFSDWVRIGLFSGLKSLFLIRAFFNGGVP